MFLRSNSYLNRRKKPLRGRRGGANGSSAEPVAKWKKTELKIVIIKLEKNRLKASLCIFSPLA